MADNTADELISRHFAALCALDQEAWVATFAPDGVRIDPGDGRTTAGHHALRRFFEALTTAFDVLAITADQSYVNGSRAAVRWTGQGRGRNGRDATFDGIDVFELDDDGRIATMWAFWDAESLLAQLQGE